MKAKSSRIFVLLSFALASMLLWPSCAPKTGCPINEEAHVQPNKKGEYPRTRTRSSLFPKEMRKRMRH
ncbi:MAG: hypothetical protein D6818_02760 [Bacteroidetes bacterium]|nr:MAG: hypothetical protein D6818_02760 [Bacteroidota bacterium]